MLNLAQKTLNMPSRLALSEIEKFYSGNKESLIGLEYERLSLDKTTLENATYFQLEKIITHFSKVLNWELVYDNETIIGAKSLNGTSISLEPGCQLEISFEPKKEILLIEIEANKIIKILDEIADNYNVIFVGYGISPKSQVDNIQLLNKRRYLTMNKYLPNCTYGELIPKMMRQSAGIQVNIDYENSSDAYIKLKFFNLIMPFISALFSNSPFENDRMTDKKSIRNHVWRFCGRNRCNLFYKNVFSGLFSSKNLFKNYISEVIDVPMIFIERENKIIEINGKMTFREFMSQGYLNYFATIEDYILHQSLCFPDVRLKKYIEIRNHDSSDLKTALSLCALYKGLSKCDLREIVQKLDFLSIDEVDKLNEKFISNGLNYKINSNFDGWDVIVLLFNCAKKKLNSKDRAYLEPILNMIKKRKTQSDILFEYGFKTTKDLIEFLY